MLRNRIEVSGYLASKPALRHLGSGTPVANVRLGESYRYQDADGKSQQHTNWHSLSFYGDLSRVAMTFDKGDNIFVEGTIEQRQFTPNGDRSRRTVHEVVVRSCHLIAPPRAGAANDAVSGAPEATIPNQAEAVDHDGWPLE
jgi:single-strand DNA-binding protein